MYKKRNLEGQTFGTLTVIKDLGHYRNNDKHFWSLVRCKCGIEFPLQDTYLINGRQSCCPYCSRKKQVTHNMTDSRIYHVYQSMKSRCYNPNNEDYESYGGRGIKICDEWKNNATSFIEWAYKSGYQENADYMECTLDRINVDGDYCPENCRWVDKIIQSRNKRNTVYMNYKGEKKSVNEVAEIVGMKSCTLKHRLKSGYSDEDAISIEVNSEYMRKKHLNYEIKRYATLIQKSTGEKHEFESCSGASRFLGHNNGYLSNLMRKRNTCQFEVENYYVKIGEYHH